MKLALKKQLYLARGAAKALEERANALNDLLKSARSELSEKNIALSEQRGEIIDLAQKAENAECARKVAQSGLDRSRDEVKGLIKFNEGYEHAARDIVRLILDAAVE